MLLHKTRCGCKTGRTQSVRACCAEATGAGLCATAPEKTIRRYGKLRTQGQSKKPNRKEKPLRKPHQAPESPRPAETRGTWDILFLMRGL
jgi:hypothetical protein